MIDIDLLDEQLDAALSAELRSRVRPLAKSWKDKARRPALPPAPARKAAPWPTESDVWLVDDQVWGADADPWPSDPDIWAGGAEAWPAQPPPEPPTRRPVTTPAARPRPQRSVRPQPDPQAPAPLRPVSPPTTTGRAQSSAKTQPKPPRPPAGLPQTAATPAATPLEEKEKAKPPAAPARPVATGASRPVSKRTPTKPGQRADRKGVAEPPAPSGWTPPSLMALPFEKATPAPGPAAPTVRRSATRPTRSPRPAFPPDRPEAKVGPAPARTADGTDHPSVDPTPAAPPAPAQGPDRSHRAPSARPRARLDVSRLDAGPALDFEGPARKIVELIAGGRIHKAAQHITAHADLAREEGSMADRRDAAAWATMRALLDGRQADARAANELVRQLGAQAHDPNADERYWQQRFWVVLEWGSEEERFELLDHCRKRAYWQQDISWRSALVLLLARMGRVDEAAREFDETASRVLPGRPHDAEWLDMTTNLAEAAALLNDARRATTLNRAVDWPQTGMVVVGQAQVCKGSIARFHALIASTTIRWAEADKAFAVATETHRRAGAQPLLARTLREWGRSLAGRDDVRSRECLEESAALATGLQLVELLPSP
ncbi:MAG: hypothetical protein M3314_07805 [Actinomycetota bacterium]|nr:hypothetical protein [Actinomycetota bacterium]